MDLGQSMSATTSRAKRGLIIAGRWRGRSTSGSERPCWLEAICRPAGGVSVVIADGHVGIAEGLLEGCDRMVHERGAAPDSPQGLASPQAGEEAELLFGQPKEAPGEFDLALRLGKQDPGLGVGEQPRGQALGLGSAAPAERRSERRWVTSHSEVPVARASSAMAWSHLATPRSEHRAQASSKSRIERGRARRAAWSHVPAQTKTGACAGVLCTALRSTTSPASRP